MYTKELASPGFLQVEGNPVATTSYPETPARVHGAVSPGW